MGRSLASPGREPRCGATPVAREAPAHHVCLFPGQHRCCLMRKEGEAIALAPQMVCRRRCDHRWAIFPPFWLEQNLLRLEYASLFSTLPTERVIGATACLLALLYLQCTPIQWFIKLGFHHLGGNDLVILATTPLLKVGIPRGGSQIICRHGISLKQKRVQTRTIL